MSETIYTRLQDTVVLVVVGWNISVVLMPFERMGLKISLAFNGKCFLFCFSWCSSLNGILLSFRVHEHE